MEHGKMPRCGALGLADGAVHWRVWAPRAEHVEFVLIASAERCGHEMTHEERGYFSYTEAHVADGQRCVSPERAGQSALTQRHAGSQTVCIGPLSCSGQHTLCGRTTPGRGYNVQTWCCTNFTWGPAHPRAPLRRSFPGSRRCANWG